MSSVALRLLRESLGLVFSMEEEIWKDVVGFEGFYKVSNFGRVVDTKKGKPLKTSINTKGYCVVGLKRKQFRLSRVVLSAFVPRESDFLQVDHIDGNRLNNNVSNLRWATSKENINNPITKKRQKEAMKKKWADGVYEGNKRKIMQFTKDGVLLRIWDSIKEAADSLGKRRATINNVLSDPVKRKSAHGFIWCYVDDIERIKQIESLRITK